MWTEADKTARAGRPLERPDSSDITSQSCREPAHRQCYLLFAGLHQKPYGGLADLVGTFTTEETARQAFRDVRLNATSPASWAQLVMVDGLDGIKPLCWFGIGATPDRRRVTSPHSDVVGALRTGGRDVAPSARRRLSRRVTAGLTGVLTGRRHRRSWPTLLRPK